MWFLEFLVNKFKKWDKLNEFVKCFIWTIFAIIILNIFAFIYFYFPLVFKCLIYFISIYLIILFLSFIYRLFEGEDGPPEYH